MEIGLSVYKNSQKFTVQEAPESMPRGQVPKSVEVICEGELADKAKPGDRVQVVGVYRSFPPPATDYTSGIFPAMIIATSITAVRELTEAPFVYTDMTNIKSVGARPDAFRLLARSFAPAICGHDTVKEGLLLQMIGGTERNLKNGTHLRGDINVLLVGDPSCGKSQMLRFVMNASPLAIATTGRGSSGVGLTAAMTKDPGSRDFHLEAGAMVLADRGVICIDEFDKMGAGDRVAIHEAMEQQCVTIAKAGMHVKLNSRCAVTAAANPKYGTFDDSMDIAANINLPDSLLSRFDLVFVVRDKTNEEIDRKITTQVLRQAMLRLESESARRGVEQIHSSLLERKKEADQSETPEATKVYERSAGDASEIVTVDFLRKYVKYCRRFTPVLSARAQEVVSEKYVDMRMRFQSSITELSNPNSTKKPRLAVTTRTLEALIRLATAHAKLKLRKDEVLEEDVLEAYRLMLAAREEDAPAAEAAPAAGAVDEGPEGGDDAPGGDDADGQDQVSGPLGSGQACAPPTAACRLPPRAMPPLIWAAWLMLAGRGSAAACEADGVCAEEDADAPALLQLDRRGDTALLGLSMIKRADLERTSIMHISAQLSATCAVGAHVACPGSGNMCAGDQCCPAINGDGRSTFICPSASPGFKNCGIKSKLRADCTGTDTVFSVPTPAPAGAVPTPAPGGAPPTLPPGWESTIDPASGKPYYFNRATGEPAAPVDPVPPTTTLPSTPPGAGTTVAPGIPTAAPGVNPPFTPPGAGTTVAPGIPTAAPGVNPPFTPPGAGTTVAPGIPTAAPGILPPSTPPGAGADPVTQPPPDVAPPSGPPMVPMLPPGGGPGAGPYSPLLTPPGAGSIHGTVSVAGVATGVATVGLPTVWDGPTSPGTSTGWYWQDCPWSEEWGQSSWQPGSGGYCGSVRYEGSGPSGQERGDDKFVPEWDGKAVPLRTYERRVKIFELNAAILPERRGGRLLSRLKGDAEAKTENLDPETLARPDGVRVLLRYLHEKYDQQETLKVGTLVDEFVEKVSRNAGEEIMDFETRYGAKVRELEEAMEEPLNKHLKAHYFLKKLRVGGDKESQIITGAGNELVYEKIRDSAKACIPRVSMLRNRAAAPFNGANREYLNRNRRRLGEPLGRGGARKVHATENAEAEAEREGAEAEGPSTSAEEDDDDEERDSEVDAGVGPNIAENELVPEELQACLTENEVLMTQAKKARAEAEKTRDFYRGPGGRASGGRGADSERIRKLKLTLPCKRCGRLGHWKDDPERPRAPGKASAAGKAAGAEGKGTWVVARAEEPAEREKEPAEPAHLDGDCPGEVDNGVKITRFRSEEEEEAFPLCLSPPSSNLQAAAGHPMSVLVAETGDAVWLIVVDTACAKSVAGLRWYRRLAIYVRKNWGIELETVTEREPYRFGPGKTIYSSQALLLPMEWDGKGAVIRISLVEEDVPPLISGGALKALEAHIHMKEAEITLGALSKARHKLRELPSGHLAMAAVSYGPGGPGAGAQEAVSRCRAGAEIALYGRVRGSPYEDPYGEHEQAPSSVALGRARGQMPPWRPTVVQCRSGAARASVATRLVFMAWRAWYQELLVDYLEREVLTLRQREDTPRSIWEMRKAELVTLAMQRLGWQRARAEAETAGQLRLVLREKKDEIQASEVEKDDPRTTLPTGLTNMKLAQLQEEAAVRQIPLTRSNGADKRREELIRDVRLFVSEGQAEAEWTPTEALEGSSKMSRAQKRESTGVKTEESMEVDSGTGPAEPSSGSAAARGTRPACLGIASAWLLGVATLGTWLEETGGGQWARHRWGTDRVDVVEFFGGGSDVSRIGSKNGWWCLRPWDAKCGADLAQESEQLDAYGLCSLALYPRDVPCIFSAGGGSEDGPPRKRAKRSKGPGAQITPTRLNTLSLLVAKTFASTREQQLDQGTLLEAVNAGLQAGEGAFTQAEFTAGLAQMEVQNKLLLSEAGLVLQTE
ncbi:unnamed protein product [Prorocentrum cordatum]|uniref:DNA helicase n=1 Tax=Prorocentrum cordatum TaxID=2364126 RepID=A0ABN9V8W5_9DINO|nr:unnamed protein product [Polarella glacialis]